MENSKVLAQTILEAVGNKDNVSKAIHCTTRLRLSLKDKSFADLDNISKIKGVLGAQWSSGQLQIIIGQHVDEVYKDFCELSGVAMTKGIDENLDADIAKPKKTVKSVFTAILDGIAGTLQPAVPALIVGGLFKCLPALFGPGLLGILSDTSDLYTLLTFLGDAAFYFLPVIIGYTGAKKFGASLVIGMLMGAIMIHPTLVGLVTASTPFTVFGIPMMAVNYSSSVLPMLLVTWVMSYVEKFFKRVLPKMFQIAFTPFFTVLVMVPLALLVLGPIGSFCGTYLAAALTWFVNTLGPVGTAIIGAIWVFVVLTGMHVAVLTGAIIALMTVGYDAAVLPAAMCAAVYAGMGTWLAFGLKAKNPDNKALGITCFVSNMLGGVTEPGIFSIGMKYKRPFIGLMAGGAAGGFLCGLLGVKGYALTWSNVLAVLGFAGDDPNSFTMGLVSVAVAFVVAFIVTWLVGFKEEEA